MPPIAGIQVAIVNAATALTMSVSRSARRGFAGRTKAEFEFVANSDTRSKLIARLDGATVDFFKISV